MEILLDENIIFPIILGAVLALAGGVITQAIFWVLSIQHKKKILIVALRAELKIIRENLGSTLAGYRATLRNHEFPKIDVFIFPSPVFDANAGNLGQLRNKDLVEHTVEVYSAIHGLNAHSDSVSNFDNHTLKISDYNEILMMASITHVQLIKLHNRLIGVTEPGRINTNVEEVESRQYTQEINDQLAKGNIDQLLQRDWTINESKGQQT